MPGLNSRHHRSSPGAVCILLLATLAFGARADAVIALIIDDLGDSRIKGERAIDLPGPVTLAVLPHTRWGTDLARRAYERQREVMLHLPMANLGNVPLGPEPLTPRLSRHEFRSRLANALKRVPGARGINNHMGSALTQEPREMTWLMQELRVRGLYFIDSRTTHKTVAKRIAHEQAVLASSRDVFLDNVRDTAAIDVQFRKLVRIARDRGTALGIGHPYPETLAYLEQRLPALADEGVQLVPASHLAAMQTIRRNALARAGAVNAVLAPRFQQRPRPLRSPLQEGS